MQTPRLPHALAILYEAFQLLNFCIVDSNRLFIRLRQCLESLTQTHVLRILNPDPPQNTIHRGENFLGDFAAELDVYTSPGHICGDGHRTQ